MFPVENSLRSKRFQSSCCAKVRAGAKTIELCRRTRAETLATLATVCYVEKKKYGSSSCKCRREKTVFSVLLSF